jgi:hypothetical protein
MKINFITLFLACMVIGTASAQDVNIGIKGGLNLYNITGTFDDDYDTRVNFHLGVLGHIHLGEHFGLQPEVLFSAQGATYGDDQKLDLNYVNVPVLFQYMFNNGFRVHIGPQVGFLVSAKADGDDVKDLFKGTELAVTAGASYVHVPSGFGLDVRYNHGLTNNYEDDDVVESFNRGFQVGIFYLFKHKS